MAVVRDLERLRSGLFPRLLVALLLVSLLPLTAKVARAQWKKLR